MRIDILPDDVLLGIFDFYVDINPWIEAWQPLVHVCRRWRSLVLGSPRRLNLRLFRTPKMLARNKLDIWPALPFILSGNMSSGTDNIIAALGQSNRVCEVDLYDLSGGWYLESVLEPMHEPFPELTNLRLVLYGETRTTPPAIPDSFLGGSAPRLRDFELDCIPFPGLPKLLLSTTHLVRLRLADIGRSGFISPEAMVASLSVLSSLDALELEFEPYQSFPVWESQSPPPRNRSILPALTRIHFKVTTEYLEDIVTFIDAPQLKTLNINFFCQIDFDTPRLAQFINRTPKLSKRDAHVQLHDNFVRVELPAGSGTLEISIPYTDSEPDRQLSSIEQVCNSSLHPLSTVENLYIVHHYRRRAWKYVAIENTLWLQLLLPFTAVKNLYLCKEFAPGIAAALQELVEGRTTGVLPSLQNVFVEGLEPSGLFQEKIGQFVAARQPSDPIVISVWHKDTNTNPM